jgi:hypothetical protein
MWKKIHSNREPRDTLYSEIHREFNTYFGAAGNFFIRGLNAYPKVFFGLMMIFMLTSAALSFTVFRHPEAKVVKVEKPVDPVGDGFSKILKTAGKIREGMLLRKMVDSLSAKKQLSSADSANLECALDSLEQIQQ